MAIGLGPVKDYVKASADALISKFGIKSAGGWRKSDPFPDHPSGHAVDFMINDLPNGHAVGDALAAYIIQNAKALGVKYIIWNRRSWNPERGTWANYTGSNPHTDHVHVTWKDAPGSGTLTDGGGISTIGLTTTGLDNTPLGPLADAIRTSLAPLAAVGKLSDKLFQAFMPSNFIRIVAGIAGFVLVAWGVLLLGREARNS